jgi:hypothetical protein
MKGTSLVRLSCILAVAGAVVSLLGVACGAFSSNDATPATDDGGTTDAPITPADGFTPPAADAGGNDGSVDASAAAEAGFCTGAEHWLCDDFDRPGALTDTPYWGSMSVTTDASLDVYQPPPPAPASPPNALTAFAHGNSGADVYAQYTGNASGFRCEFDVRVDQRGTAPVNLVVLSLYFGASGYYRLQLTGGADQLSEYGLFEDGGPITPMVLGSHYLGDKVWQRIQLEVKLGPGGHVKTAINGQDLALASAYALGALPIPKSSTVQLGLASYGGTGAWTVVYDNVTCDPLP